MRKISLIVAFAVVLASPSVAGSSQRSSQGSSQRSLPGIGTFSYSGSVVATPAPAMVIAGLTTADRS